MAPPPGSPRPVTKPMVSQTQLARYKKTGGAADGAGNDYEHKMLTLVFLRMLKAGYEFQLASNMEAAGLFDDIVVRYRELSEEDWQVTYLQLKHKQKKTISKAAFLGLSGDFSLVKYCVSYNALGSDQRQKNSFDGHNHKIVIFTNASVNDGLVCEVEADPLLSTGGKAVSFKAGGEVFQELCEWVDFKEALTKLHGQVEGLSEAEVATRIKEVVQDSKYLNIGITSCSADLLKAPTISKLRESLTKLEPVKDKDTYSRFLCKLEVYTIQAHESELDTKIKECFGKVWKCSVDLEAGAMLHALQAKVKSWWQKDNFYLTQDSPLWLDIIKDHIEALSASTTERLTEFDVEIKECALQILYDRINKVSKTGGILNIRVDSRTAASSLRVHQALAKFRPNEIVLHVNVKALLEREDDVLSAWASLWCRLLVVECDTKLDQSQAGRIGAKIKEATDIDNENKLLVLIAPKEHDLNVLLYGTESYSRFNDNFVWSDLEEKAQKNILSNRVEINGRQSSLTLSNLIAEDNGFFNKVDLEVISQFLLKDVSCGKNLHEVGKFFVNRRLQNSADAKPFVVNSWSDVRQKVALLVAEPGMGKSTLITHLANSAKKEDPSAWIVHLNLNDCVEYLKEINMDHFNELTVTTFLEQAAFKSFSSFEKLLLGALLHKLVVFVDGVDEVCPHYEQQVFKLLSFLKDMKISRLWVASRPVFQTKLETTLQVKSLNLVAFTEEDLIEFFNKMWIANVPSASSEKCSEVTESLMTLLNDSLGKDNPILGVPLMAVMIAEIFQERFFSVNGEAQAFQKNERFDVMNLYSMFIKKKFDLYCVEKKKTPNRELTANIDDEETLLRQMHHRHRLAALRVLFSREEIAGLQFEGKYTFDQDLATYLQEVSDGREKLGIIDNVMDGNPHFVHRSFAEYFAASWLALHFKDNKRFIERIIFDPAYKLVSEMFHRSLAENHSLHVAVLNRDLEAVKSFLNGKPNKKDVNELDAGGRTPLHLAVLLSGTDRHPDYVTIVEYLSKQRKTNSFSDDKVLGLTTLEYAESARAWKALQILLNNIDVSFKMIQQVYRFPRPDASLMLDAARDASVLIVRHLVEERGGKLNCRGTEGETMIHRAAQGDNKETLKYLHKTMKSLRFLPGSGIDIGAVNKQGLTAFQEAARHGAYNAMAVFLKLKASFNVSSSTKASKVQLNASLLCAAFSGSLESVRNLVKKGASVSYRDNKGHTAAWVAMHRIHYHVMDWLLLSGYKNGDTPLNLACKNGELEIVTYLLSRGDNIEAKGVEERTPLMTAALNNRMEVMELLLERGANLDGGHKDGNTMLHFVSWSGEKEAVELALRYGAQVKTTNSMGETSLHRAIISKKFDVVNLFLENDNHQPGDKLTQPSRNGITQLVAAAIKGDLDDVRKILDNFNEETEGTSKADFINMQDTLGWTVLHFLVRLNNSSLIKYLISEGGDQHIGDTNNTTPLHLAAILKHPVTLRVLLAALPEAVRAAAVITFDNEGNSVLYCAARGGCLECVGLVFEAGGKLRQVNNRGRTPLMIAATMGNDSLVSFLLRVFDVESEGMTLKDFINMKDKVGKTALDLARTNECRKVLKDCITKT